jgi:hypothetical protein
MSNALASIGHNAPPGPVQSAKDALIELNAYLTENPVIQDQKQAKEAGGWIKRTRDSLQSLENERTEKVGPLNVQLKALNDLYRGVRDPLEKILLELKRRVTAYATAQEDKNRAEAERLRKEAEEAAERARHAATLADDAVASVDVGECIDAGAAIADADAAIKAAGIAERTAARAEREQTARIGSVMGGKALSMRTQEVLSVTDAVAAIKCMGEWPELHDEIRKRARAYREDYGHLPEGITKTIERRM